MAKNELIRPVVKWVGGKRQLLKEITPLIPKRYTTYCEPFVGGAAVLLSEQPSSAVVNDANTDLISMYRVIRDNPDGLLDYLKQQKNESEWFYKVRSIDRDPSAYAKMTDVEKAGRLIYLNKTCYNGLFRVNASGEFNSPFGAYKRPDFINEITVRALSAYFNEAGITLLDGDYSQVISRLDKGSFVYLDPPYDPISESAAFTGYTKGGFDRDEQTRLRDFCVKLDAAGVKFLLSNSRTEFILDLYSDFNISIVEAKRAINSKGNGRGTVQEVLVRNY